MAERVECADCGATLYWNSDRKKWDCFICDNFLTPWSGKFETIRAYPK